MINLNVIKTHTTLDLMIEFPSALLSAMTGLHVMKQRNKEFLSRGASSKPVPCSLGDTCRAHNVMI